MADPAASSPDAPWSLAILFVFSVGATLFLFYQRRLIERLRLQNRSHARQKQTVYEFLRQIGVKMSAQIDLEGTLETIVSFLVDTTRAQGGAVFLKDPSGEFLRARVLVGMFPPLQETLDYALTKIKFLHQKMKKELIPVGKGIIGEVAARGEALLIGNAREDPRVPQTAGLETDTMIAAPLIVHGRTVGVFALVNRIGGGAFTEEDLNMLRALAEHASVTVHMVQMYDAMAEKQRMENELRIAEDFQKMLLPKQAPQIPGVEIAATSLPALEVGGDFYDFFWLDGNRLGIVIADVAGKGIPGALIMSMVRSVVRAESPHATSPRAVLERVNQTVFADTREKVFITMIFAILDLTRRTLTFARAGHEPLVMCSRSSGGMRLLTPDGIALGLVDDHLFSAIRDQEIPLHDGDTAILYTDGVIEAMDERGHEYGQERFLEMLRTHSESSAEDLLHTLVTDVRHFARGGRQSDDITLVVLKFNRLAGRAEALDSADASRQSLPGLGGQP